MTLTNIQFVRRGRIVTLSRIPPDRTLLEVLREDLNCCGTKEGCNEGDCGACTVVLGEAQGEHLKYSAVNSCIRLAHSIHGLALWTVEDLALADGSLHPVQQAMVQNHASQCGFCTPGFVMSLFGMYQNHVCQGRSITRSMAQQALSGNLCRCTGYRPILNAAQQMADLPLVPVEETEVLGLLRQIRPERGRSASDAQYLSPLTLNALLAARAAHPEAQIVAGGTDVVLSINKQHRSLAKVLDVTRVQELRRIEVYPHHIAIGAAVTLSEAFAALVQDRPQLQVFAHRFAGMPVRNAGTLGGNVANGSPIGDSMPLLMALGANVVLMSAPGAKTGHRELPLEQLYIGYRKTLIAPDEVLAWIKVPKARPGELTRVYKISKRFEDDISAVCLALQLYLDQDQTVAHVSIGVGGVAATPVRADKTEAVLRGQAWTSNSVQQATDTLRAEFLPISDMRASSTYRSQVLGNLLRRFWLETQGASSTDLDSFKLEEDAP